MILRRDEHRKTIWVIEHLTLLYIALIVTLTLAAVLIMGEFQ